jgi:stage II sporulation protein D
MKNIVYYTFLMLLIVIMLPFLIVTGNRKTNDESPAPQTNIAQEDTKIKIYISQNKKVMEVELDEYIKCVVAAEMPADFEHEALKAQAVAARTYAYRKKVLAKGDEMHHGADICTDSTHCQAWVSKNDAMKRWDAGKAAKNWEKIEKAVEETHNIIITYDDNIANPVFHANSGGMTENSEDVWEGVGEPYLRSVPSKGEEIANSYKSEQTIKIKDFYNALRKIYPKIKLNTANILEEINIIEYSEGGRAKTIKIGNVMLKGTDFREMFSLRSTNIKIEMAGKESLKITTYGYGHGVGMSQWGANAMAKSGSSFEEIIKHYYRGVSLTSIGELDD